MGSTQKILELIPTIITIKVLGKVASKFSSGRGKDFSHERSFSRLNKKEKQRI